MIALITRRSLTGNLHRLQYTLEEIDAIEEMLRKKREELDNQNGQ